VGLLAASSVVGTIAHALFDPRSGTPCIGASGGISGVIAFYAAQYPHARLGIIFRYLFMIRWLRLPAWAALLAWLLMQCLLAYMQVLGVGRVSAMAHLGGAAAGFAAWAIWRQFKREDLPRSADESTDDIAAMFSRIRNAPKDVATVRQ
jgi:membrane associated rhomboid family serine protease